MFSRRRVSYINHSSLCRFFAFKSLKGMAKSDSLPTAMTAMINLCSMVVEDPVLELLSEVLSVLYHHLQGDPASLPVKEKVLGFEPETVMAATSLAFMAQFFSSQYLGPEVLSSIEDQWPSIWRWASYIVEQGIVMERDEPVEGQIMSRGHLQGVMGDLFSALTAQDRLCEIIGSSPGVVPTITRLYFFAGQNAHPSQILLSQALQRLIVDLNMTLEATAIQGFWEGTASAFNVRPSDLASALLSSINNELSRPKIACFPLLGSLINLSGCTRDGGAFTLAGGSIHERSVSSMVRIFSRLTSRKQFYDRHPVNYRMAVGCLKFTGQYLQRCFDYGGFSCIIEAVEGHLLSSILKAHRFVEYELEYPIPAPPVRLQTILVDLLKTVGSYTVYRSVLRAVYNSCGRIRKHSTEDDLNKHSALYESWRTFKDMIQPRVDIWGYWEEDDDINVCGRASVGQSAAPSYQNQTECICPVHDPNQVSHYAAVHRLLRCSLLLQGLSKE